MSEKIADAVFEMELDLGSDPACVIFRDGRSDDNPCDGFDKTPMQDMARSLGKAKPLYMARVMHEGGVYVVAVSRTEPVGELDVTSAQAYVQKQIDSIAGRRTVRGGAEPHLSRFKGQQLLVYSTQLEPDRTNAAYVLTRGGESYLIATETDDAHAQGVDAIVRRSLTSASIKEQPGGPDKTNAPFRPTPLLIAAALAVIALGYAVDRFVRRRPKRKTKRRRR